MPPAAKRTTPGNPPTVPMADDKGWPWSAPSEEVLAELAALTKRITVLEKLCVLAGIATMQQIVRGK